MSITFNGYTYDLNENRIQEQSIYGIIRVAFHSFWGPIILTIERKEQIIVLTVRICENDQILNTLLEAWSYMSDNTTEYVECLFAICIRILSLVDEYRYTRNYQIPTSGN